MSLTDNIATLAERVATEFNSVRTALSDKANTSHTHGVTDLTATGTADATTFLRGDNTWATPSGGATAAPGEVWVTGSGIDPTGATSSKTAITALLATSGLRHLRFPAGTFVTDSLTVPAGVRVSGEGRSTLIDVPAGTAASAFIVGGDDVTIENLAIDGNGSSKTTDTAAIASTDHDRVTVRDVHVSDWRGNGVRFTDGAAPRVLGCTFDAIYRSADGWGAAVRALASTADLTDLLISECRATNTAGSAFEVAGDWNRSDWRTAGVKVVRPKLVGCHAENAGYGGIFLNATVAGVIDGCTARNCADYGIGVEFTRDTTIVGCTTDLNDTFGISVFQAGENVAISGCTTRGNSLDGVHIHWGNIVSGDTVRTSDIAISATTSKGNGRHGFAIINSRRVVFSGGSSTNNGEHGLHVSGSDDCAAGTVDLLDNGWYGIRIEWADNFNASSCLIRGNSNGGVSINADGGNQAENTNITGCQIISNTNFGIKLHVDAPKTSITNCQINNNTGPGVTGDYPKRVRVTGNYLEDNGTTGNIYMLQPFDIDVSANSLLMGNTTSENLNLPDSGGFTGGRMTIKSNYIKGGVRGMRVAAGDNVSAGDDVFVINNTIVGATTPYAFSGSSAARLHVVAEVVGSPEGVLGGCPGSIARRLDGGASTSLYVKQTGGNGTTGWVAK